MKRRISVVTGLLMLLTSATLSAAEITPEMKKSLHEALENWATLYNKHDAKALGKEYTIDAEMVAPSGERLKGRPAIEKEFAETFAENPNVRVRLIDVTWRMLTPRIVIEEGKWEESGNSETDRPTSGLYTAILVKAKEKWRSKYEVSFVAIPTPSDAK